MTNDRGAFRWMRTGRARAALSSALGGLMACGVAAGQPTATPGVESAESVLADAEPVSAARRTAGLAVYWENDGTYAKPINATDRHYTNGVAFAISFQSEWAQALAAHMPFAEQFGAARTAAGVTVGQLMYTPDNISRREPIPDDWPYNGLLYSGLYWQRSRQFSDAWATLDHFQIDLGVIGSASQAREFQKFVHQVRGLDDPKGWGNQHVNQLAVQFTLRKKWRLDLPLGEETAGDVQPAHLQLIPHVGGQVGNIFRHVEGGATLRLGWNLPGDFGPGRLSDLPDATGEAVRGWSFYVYGRANGRIVEHNEMLVGRDFALEEETFTGRLGAGLVLAYGWENLAVEFSYATEFLADRFEGQAGSDSFGALAWSVRWTY